MLRFISFGSGSSGNCYYLFTENDGILIDLGVGVRNLKKHFREYGLSLSKVKHILITHDHADHVKSVGSVSRDFSLQVFSTHQVHVGINKNYCVRNKISPDLVRIIEKGNHNSLIEKKGFYYDLYQSQYTLAQEPLSN